MQSKRQESMTLPSLLEETLEQLATVMLGTVIAPTEAVSEKKPYPFVKWACL
jgi:hypothetical protein